MIPRPKRENVNFDNNYIQQEENKNIEGIPENIYPETTISKPKIKKIKVC